MKEFRLFSIGLIAFVFSAICYPASPAYAQEPAAPAAEPQWVEDFAKAAEAAKEQKKDLFVNFCGSDWCVWCQRLEGEVLSKKEFLDEVQKQFVLCRLDFPRYKQSPNKEANEKTRAAFMVMAFPTVLLLDSEAKVYAKTGYVQGGPAAYLPHLKSFAERKDKLAEMDKALAGMSDPKADAPRIEEMVKTLLEWEILASRPAALDKLYAIDPDNAVGARLRAVAYRMILAISSHSRDRAAFDAMKKEITGIVLKAAEAAGTPEAGLQVIDAELSRLKAVNAGKESLVGALRELLAKVSELDPENKAGLKIKYAADLLFAMINDKDEAGAEAQKKTIRELDPKNESGQLERLVLLEANEMFRAKKFAEAAKCIDDFFAACKAKDDEITLRWAAGFCFWRAGDGARAVPYFKRIIEMQPDSEFAKRSTEILRQIEEAEKKKEGGEKQGE